MNKACRHCGRAFKPGPHGGRKLLCNGCYERPEVRAGYVAKKASGPEGRRLPKEPTHHRPGTEGKVEVMRQRYERGEHLHHPDDAKFGATDGGE